MITAILTGALILIGIGAAIAWWARRVQVRMLEGHAQLSAKTEELAAKEKQNADMEGRYRALFDSVPVAIIVSQLDGTLIDINDAAVRIFGYTTRAEAMAVNIRSVYVNPAERDRRLASSLQGDGIKQAEHLMRRKDGSNFPALAQTQVIRDADGKPSRVEGFVTDISEYKRLADDRRAMEHEQRISQRLKSVGALAAGIAHEINTPMQFVSDSVYFLKTAVTELNLLWPELADLSRRSRVGKEQTDTIERIEAVLSSIGAEQLVVDANESAERALDGIRRVTKIIRAMREFAHPDNGEHTQVDINNAIETTLTVCKNVYKEVAEVETDFGPLPMVSCQYGEINQVLLNIIVNAAHAIEGQKNPTNSGRIRIATQLEDPWVVIRIEDNGAGIPDSVKARIFDPFFTTKEVGKGTGQGLAIVQSVIVERHKGRISVESEVGKGTAFILRLPIADPRSARKEVEHEQET